MLFDWLKVMWQHDKFVTFLTLLNLSENPNVGGEDFWEILPRHAIQTLGQNLPFWSFICMLKIKIIEPLILENAI